MSRAVYEANLKSEVKNQHVKTWIRKTKARGVGRSESPAQLFTGLSGYSPAVFRSA